MKKETRDEKRQLKIIRILSDYEEVNRSYIYGLVTKEELNKACTLIRKEMVKMELSENESKYATMLLSDSSKRLENFSDK